MPNWRPIDGIDSFIPPFWTSSTSLTNLILAARGIEIRFFPFLVIVLAPRVGGGLSSSSFLPLWEREVQFFFIFLREGWRASCACFVFIEKWRSDHRGIYCLSSCSDSEEDYFETKISSLFSNLTNAMETYDSWWMIKNSSPEINRRTKQQSWTQSLQSKCPRSPAFQRPTC